MGAIPKDCTDLSKITNTGITLIVSLREEDEIYQACNSLNKPIFWRFRIPDFSTQDPEDVKALIDNIINYLYSDVNSKVMIHCLGGHGRTGTIICCLIAVIIFLNPLFKGYTVIQEIHNELESLNLLNDSFINFDKKLTLLCEKIFKCSQLYTMLSLSTYRRTDSLLNRDVHGITVPETFAQNLLVCNVIKLYIKFYLRNNYFNITLSNIKLENLVKCNELNYTNDEFDKIWKCANLKTCSNI